MVFMQRHITIRAEYLATLVPSATAFMQAAAASCNYAFRFFSVRSSLISVGSQFGIIDATSLRYLGTLLYLNYLYPAFASVEDIGALASRSADDPQDDVPFNERDLLSPSHSAG